MKENELRIGNYIIKGNGAIGQIYIIDPINDSYGLSSEGSDIVMRYNFEQLKPIPLTEEWLLKFGFKERDDEGYRDIRIRNKLYLAIDLKKWEAIIGYKIEWTRPIKIRYVHQLQNLYFALTGEELESLKSQLAEINKATMKDLTDSDEAKEMGAPFDEPGHASG